ncbi:hypothetical protein B566_EDAN011988 [Ephemera danica]|nr:hypothetical protein B566_EDAN011988 [Ephemera danica]
MYLGYRRLARHFESYPDHGSMDLVPRGPSKSSDGQKGSDAVNGGASANKFRLKRRGAHLMLTPLMKLEKRKARLTELLSGYNEAEIAEIAGPMVAQSLDIWQLLLMKISTNKEQPSRLTSLLAELKTLLDTARSRVAEVTDTTVATALNISCGVYNVMDIDDRRLQWRPSGFNLQSSNSSALAPESLPQPQAHSAAGQSPAAKKLKLWTHDAQKAGEGQSEKSFMDTTAESEKPSDTSMGSDTPLDDFVHAELKKSGLEDFVVPPPVVTSSLGHSQVVDFVTSTFSSAVQDSGSHFSSDLVMNMPSVVVTSDSSLSKMETVHFQLPAASSGNSRLDLSSTGIDVHLDSQLEEPTHELDFEALSEEFNRNTNS